MNFSNRMNREIKDRRRIFPPRLKLTFCVLVIVSFIFIANQVSVIQTLVKYSNYLSPNKSIQGVSSRRLRGTHPEQATLYENKNGTFHCITSMEKIDFTKINDNYCDCLDGSDEPGTSACPNGVFYCDTQIIFQNFPKVISSNKVNDGICDCCDGSDEWETSQFSKVRRPNIPCKNLCPTRR